ncbi:lipopolysaccharide biosynthesis protein [Jiulongibacter sediminis]|uniref:Polysaccharide biosynthesis protein n=1 Tax=Jiulongibacter sediminis TaxID=1605367 RepID=A0A0P7C761_9BACT|nr:polysaccharide biosynthesis C-terminal domain-containing protein [Jiulongibacter sediminis]KPM48221.1 polysaccharide biosynthesis protein [Jiulongibacter sediminis]TBX24764.1 polysaccharide biosynthesis protein [Jiulongibacter sediminis]
MSFLKKLAGDTVLYGLSSIVGRLLNWLLVVVHTRVFEQPRLLSDNAQLYSWVIPLNVLYTFGMETAFFRYGSKKENQNEYFNIILTFIILLGGTLSTLFILGATPLIEALGYPGKERLIVWLAIIIAVDAICAIAFVKLRAQNKARRFVKIKLASIFINIGLNAFYLIFCHNILNGVFLPDWKEFAARFYNPSIGPDYIIWANYVASMITLLLLWKEFVGYRFAFNWEKLKVVLKYAYPLLIMGLAGAINLTADRLMFRELLPDGFYTGQSTDDAFSIYANVYKLSIFMTLVVQAYRYAADPFFFSKMGDKNSPGMIALSTKWFTIACVVLWLVVSLNLDWIGLLIGSTYRDGLPVVPILLLANLFIGIYGNTSIWYKLTDKTHYGTYITIGGMLITVVLNLILIPQMGYIGCAITFVISSFLMVAACYYFGQIHFPVPYETQRILLYLLVAGGLILLNSYVRFENLALGVSLHLLQCLLFLVFIYFLEKKNFSKFKAI